MQQRNTCHKAITDQKQQKLKKPRNQKAENQQKVYKIGISVVTTRIVEAEKQREPQTGSESNASKKATHKTDGLSSPGLDSRLWR